MVKIKILKNLISIVCAATVVTSCVAPSVGAFRAPANSSEDFANEVFHLNNDMKSIGNTINGMLEITKREAQKCLVSNDKRRRRKLLKMISKLDQIQKDINELNEVVVNSSEDAYKILVKIISLNNAIGSRLRVGEADPKLCNYFPEGYFDIVLVVRKRLTNIKNAIEKNKNGDLTAFDHDDSNDDVLALLEEDDEENNVVDDGVLGKSSNKNPCVGKSELKNSTTIAPVPTPVVKESVNDESFAVEAQLNEVGDSIANYSSYDEAKTVAAKLQQAIWDSITKK